jgi:hypothetical protein
MLPWCTPTRNSIRCSTGIYGKSVDLPKLDILLCWLESGNGPKTDIAVASIHVAFGGEADLLSRELGPLAQGLFRALKLSMGVDRSHQLSRRLNYLIRLLIPVFYRPHQVHMALGEAAARLQHDLRVATGHLPQRLSAITIAA